MSKIIITATIILSLGYSCILGARQQPRTAKDKPESAKSKSQEQDPKALIERAINVTGMRKIEKPIHLQTMEWRSAMEQSDRSYGPFLCSMSSLEIWYDVQNGVERDSRQTVWPGNGPNQPQTSVSGLKAGLASPPSKLNAYAVLMDWNSADGVEVIGREVYRDYPRIVLSRQVNGTEERLFLDPKTGFPVKLESLNKHSLWGQVRVEYVYSDWIRVENMFIPGATFQVTDGETTISRTMGKIELVDKDKTPDMTVPPPNPSAKDTATLMKEVNQTKTVQVTPSTYLLVSRAYTEMVTLIDGTVYLLDATSNEERAKTDANYIKQLFPGNHPVVVVVTDLAWPHIAGVRYWVAQGATIVSHKSSRDFLTKVVERRWTLEPDSLEKNRKNVKLKFIGIDSKYELAGGKLQLYPIDGIASEGSLMAYIADEQLLWASDYIQNLRAASSYATEVMNAVQRAGIQPERVAAEHIPLSEWAKIVALQAGAN
jgi:hypothetical protein